MRRRTESVILCVLASLCLGSSCQEELRQDTATAFFTELAADLANVLTDRLFG